MSHGGLAKNRKFDWATISIYLSLVVIGWLMLYSVLHQADSPYQFLNPNTEIGKQTIWVGVALVAFAAVMTVDWNFWNTLAFPIYGVSLLLLILVLIIGSEIKGAKSWFSFGFFSFQPSEVAKFGTALALASYMSFRKNELKSKSVIFTGLAIFFVPIFLILLQPDAGSAVVFLSFFILLYRKGFSPLFYFLVLSLGLVFVLSFLGGPFGVTILVLYAIFGLSLFQYRFDLKTIGLFLLSGIVSFIFYRQDLPLGVWITPFMGFLVTAVLHIRENNALFSGMIGGFAALLITFSFSTNYAFNNYLKPHQQDRINAWLQPEKCDPTGSLYNIIQSKLAIGSGGFAGKGFLNGDMTKLNYVPEQSNDFIFSSIGEEQGFMGVFGVILLFTLLLIRLVIMAERARLEFIRNYLYCVAGILFFHFFINIGMTMGVMPVIGIPLPFMSQGGSALLSFSIMLGVAIKMDANRFRS